jgi:hypothetical protein
VPIIDKVNRSTSIADYVEAFNVEAKVVLSNCTESASSREEDEYGVEEDEMY